MYSGAFFSRKLKYKYFENKQIVNHTKNLCIFVVICIPAPEFNKTGSLSLITKAPFLERYSVWNQEQTIQSKNRTRTGID